MHTSCYATASSLEFSTHADDLYDVEDASDGDDEDDDDDYDDDDDDDGDDDMITMMI